MVYILIISLLIEKLFYLLRPQLSFSIQIVSNTFVKFFNIFYPRGGAFEFLLSSQRRVYVYSDCPGGGLMPLRVMSREEDGFG